MTLFGSSMTEKTVVEARARKISESSRLRWVVGGRAMHVSLLHVREALGSNQTRARRSPTEPERLHCKLRVTQPERSVDPWLLTEPDRVIPLLLLLTKAGRPATS